MILTGRQIKGKNAVKMGLADAMLPTERMLELAKSYLLEKRTGRKKSMKYSIK
jgi:enoyl-CoA hydratase/carnithine racemase